MRKKDAKVFESLFGVYVLSQTFSLPTLPNLEQFFKDVATSNANDNYEALMENSDKKEIKNA